MHFSKHSKNHFLKNSLKQHKTSTSFSPITAPHTSQSRTNKSNEPWTGPWILITGPSSSGGPASHSPLYQTVQIKRTFPSSKRWTSRPVLTLVIRRNHTTIALFHPRVLIKASKKIIKERSVRIDRGTKPGCFAYAFVFKNNSVSTWRDFFCRFLL